MHATIPLDDLVARWNFKNLPVTWPEAWTRATATRPAEIPFLTDSAILESSGYCSISPELRAALLNSAAVIRTDPLMAQTAWFIFCIYFAGAIPSSSEIATWPFVSQFVKGPAAMIPALVMLAGVERIRTVHRNRQIPEKVTRDTLTDIEIWIQTYRRQQGEWGLSNIYWLAHHFAGHIFRLGRLQFIHKPFAGPLHAFTHKTTGRVLALSTPDVKIRSDGYVDGTNDVFESQAFTPSFIASDNSVTGHPIHPLGRVLSQPVTLSLADWMPTLAPGDPILDIHIPETGPMDFDLCGDSLRQAIDFFPRHFSEFTPAIAFHCSTWFFDSQYQSILPPSSNIVRFQREFHLFPALSHDREAFLRVFVVPPIDLTTASRNTTLQRSMLDFTLAGNRLRCAGGFLPIHGLNWGSARYQTSIPESF
ncbi:MAG: acyltransferase domain-containing protein [bacterium]